MPIDASQIKPTKHVKPPQTLMDFLTENNKYGERIGYLQELSRKVGPWADYYAFFKANMSGDISTFSKENRKKCDKILSDLKDRYAEDYGA